MLPRAASRTHCGGAEALRPSPCPGPTTRKAGNTPRQPATSPRPTSLRPAAPTTHLSHMNTTRRTASSAAYPAQPAEQTWPRKTIQTPPRHQRQAAAPDNLSHCPSVQHVRQQQAAPNLRRLPLPTALNLHMRVRFENSGHDIDNQPWGKERWQQHIGRSTGPLPIELNQSGPSTGNHPRPKSIGPAPVGIAPRTIMRGGSRWCRPRARRDCSELAALRSRGALSGRARGDCSAIGTWLAGLRALTPHTRGLLQLRRLDQLQPRVGPALAGIAPAFRSGASRTHCRPRARGDYSKGCHRIHNRFMSAPRSRGWFRGPARRTIDHRELVSSRVRARRTRACQSRSKTVSNRLRPAHGPAPLATHHGAARRPPRHRRVRRTVYQRPAIVTCTTDRNGLQDSGQHPRTRHRDDERQAGGREAADGPAARHRTSTRARASRPPGITGGRKRSQTTSATTTAHSICDNSTSPPPTQPPPDLGQIPTPTVPKHRPGPSRTSTLRERTTQLTTLPTCTKKHELLHRPPA